MVRIRKRDSVKLTVLGPKAIVKQKLAATAKWNETWYQFLSRSGLQLTPQNGLYVRTTQRKLENGEQWGWNAELDEPIGTFVSKYERQKQSYTVRLMLKAKVPASTQSTFISPRAENLKIDRKAPIVNRRSTKTTRRASTVSSDSNGIYLKPRYSPRFSQASTRGDRVTRLRSRIDKNATDSEQCSRPINSGNLQNRNVDAEPTAREEEDEINPEEEDEIHPEEDEPTIPRIIDVRSLANIETSQMAVEMGVEEEEPMGNVGGTSSEGNNEGEVGNGNNESFEDEVASGGIGMDIREDEDNVSISTSAATQESELRQRGIQVEDVKLLVEGRIARFSNAYMLRIRAEIKRLRDNGLWDRNVFRSPLACYMLREMFKYD